VFYILLLRKLSSEFIGTAFLVMTVIGSGIMGQNLSQDNLTILIANTIATAAGLTALIWIFISISGAHFNPVVTLVMLFKKEIKKQEAILFIAVQFLGGLLGVLLTHVMFDLSLIQFSTNDRSGNPFYLAEIIATFGLLITILGVRKFNLIAVGPAVGLYIAAGYWFTSSTSFANPAVTLARGFTDTFTGIDPMVILPFILSQIIGAILAMFFMNFLLDE
jgi:glycerol uptake facilitator-like aquaporin